MVTSETPPAPNAGAAVTYEAPRLDEIEAGSGRRAGVPLSGATIGPVASVAVILTVLVILAVVSRYSFLLFHTLAELFFIMMAVSVAVVAWVLREYLDDDFSLLLGAALVTTGTLRMVHAIDFSGMVVISSPDPNQATQLWVAAVYLLSVSLAVSPLFIGRRVRLSAVVAVYGGATAAVLLSIYRWDVFPTCYVVGSGLTPFKKVSEYVVCGIFVVAVVMLLRRRAALRPAAVRLLVVALALMVAAEFLFTIYVGVYTWPLTVGHLLTVLAVYLIYLAVVGFGMARPHALVVANLMLEEEAARTAVERTEAVRAAYEHLLELTLTFHDDLPTDEIALAVCRAARRVFECGSATLFSVVGDRIVCDAREPRARLMKPGVTFDITGDVGLRRLVQTRVPSFLPDASEHPLLPLGVDRRLQKRAESALRVAIGAGPAADKVLILVWGETRTVPDPRLKALAQRFADQAGVALAQAARREALVEARSLHEELVAGLLPTAAVVHPQVEVTTRYRPGERRLELGGDFIGALDLPDGRLAVVVGDVSGHGPRAAALGSTLRASWRAAILGGADLVQTTTTLARVLSREQTREPLEKSERTSVGEAFGDEQFVTLCGAIVDPVRGEVEIVNVAHPLPLLLGAEVEILDVPPSLPLGIGEEEDFRPTTLPLPDGWTLLFYSDGLVETRTAPGSAERLGTEGLVDVLREERAHGWDDGSLDRILASIELANGGPFGDDVAAVMLSARQDGHQPASQV